MKIVKNVFRILIISLLSFLFFGCPDFEDDGYGEEIANYPEWLGADSYLTCVGYSAWTSWQSEQGKKLHNYATDIINKDYDGKFRLILNGQCVYLSFNDVNQSGGRIFYNWVSSIDSCNTSIDIPQNDIENKYEYSCYAKTNLSDEKTDANKAYVLLTRLDNGSELGNKFNFTFTIAGNEIINMDLKNDNTQNVRLTRSKYSWIRRIENYIRWTSDVQEVCLFTDYLAGPKYCACYEGISLRGNIEDIDNENQEISFNLLDAAESEFADYFTLKVAKNLETASITYYKLDGETPVVVRSDTNLACDTY